MQRAQRNPATKFSRRAVLASAGAAALAASPQFAGRAVQAQSAREPVTSHPRLWLTEADLPRLRTWATASNPIWQEGLLVNAEALVALMDEGVIPDQDAGGIAWEQYPTEGAAHLFAFISLLHPDETAREAYAERARTLLMYVIGEAAKGPAEGERFREPTFALFDRSRWWGEAFPLTVDWIYPILTAEDKATIRTVFLRWAEENSTAAVTGERDHPQPVGLVNDPALLADPIAVRWAGNNYFDAHMRNIGLMSLALDPADDPDGALRAYLESATGAWLYMADALLRGDARGGLPAEGFEYSQQALAYVVQFLLALHTAGEDDPDRLGPQVVLPDNPFWAEVIPAYLHSLSPAPVVPAEVDYLGPVYQPAWYGDGESYWGPDFIGVFGALARYDDLTGDTARRDAVRWIQRYLPPGGEEMLLYRMSSPAEATIAILYFLLFDPEAPEPADPRPGLPLTHLAPGIGRLLARTGWDEDARWFTWALGWNTVDHQHCDGNQFEFYRQGEWLTKEYTGYGFAIGSSDYHNTLAIENDPPYHNDPDGYPSVIYQRGSQWPLIPSGDPEILALGIADSYVHATGDATNLYNSAYEESTDAIHASRSIVWLPPDHIVIYDRAETATEGRFKRFWLNLPAEPIVEGAVATMTTAGGQQLVVTTLLPGDAEIATEPSEQLIEETEKAVGEPMRVRLRVEAPGGPPSARFLHVLQGVDAGAASDPAVLIESDAGAPYAGAVVNGMAVLFPVDLEPDVRELTYTVPAGTSRHLITGLQPGADYTVEIRDEGEGLLVTIQAGGDRRAGGDGVLVVDGGA